MEANTPPAREEGLTVSEAIERIGISRATFYRLIGEGRITPARRVGSGRGRPYFSPAELDAYLEQGNESGAA